MTSKQILVVYGSAAAKAEFPSDIDIISQGMSVDEINDQLITANQNGKITLPEDYDCAIHLDNHPELIEDYNGNHRGRIDVPVPEGVLAPYVVLVNKPDFEVNYREERGISSALRWGAATDATPWDISQRVKDWMVNVDLRLSGDSNRGPSAYEGDGIDRIKSAIKRLVRARGVKVLIDTCRLLRSFGDFLLTLSNDAEINPVFEGWARTASNFSVEPYVIVNPGGIEFHYSHNLPYHYLNWDEVNRLMFKPASVAVVSSAVVSKFNSRYTVAQIDREQAQALVKSAGYIRSAVSSPVLAKVASTLLDQPVEVDSRFFRQNDNQVVLIVRVHGKIAEDQVTLGQLEAQGYTLAVMIRH